MVTFAYKIKSETERETASGIRHIVRYDKITLTLHMSVRLGGRIKQRVGYAPFPVRAVHHNTAKKHMQG